MRGGGERGGAIGGGGGSAIGGGGGGAICRGRDGASSRRWGRRQAIGLLSQDDALCRLDECLLRGLLFC